MAGTAGGPRAAEPLLSEGGGCPQAVPSGGTCLPRASPGFRLRASREASLIQGGQRRSGAPALTPTLPLLHRHLAQNPFICDCNLKWLADFLRTNPIETSGARCASPGRLANKRIGQIKSKKFRCSGSCLPPVCLPFARGLRGFLAGSSKDVPGVGPKLWTWI